MVALLKYIQVSIHLYLSCSDPFRTVERFMLCSRALHFLCVCVLDIELMHMLSRKTHVKISETSISYLLLKIRDAELLLNVLTIEEEGQFT